ncbi:MAG: hypothetical protein B6241_01790 [Spirochaetaceae bacterium 4572_59]|nr:MAG: hypothetical protein B6241_01790 [Spirochaetaceae bacterium 4572_59]
MIMTKVVIAVYLLLKFISCKLSDSDEFTPPLLSNIELRSTSFRNNTDLIYAADTLFICVGFFDRDNDPDTLYLSINSSTGTLIYSEGIGKYGLKDESIWNASFDTKELSTGNYSITLYALDMNGNKSNTLTKDFTIQTDPRNSITTADVSVSLLLPNFFAADSGTGEPFRVNYQIQNNASITIDLIQVEFRIKNGSDILERTTGIMNKLTAGELRADIAKASIPQTQNVSSVEFDPTEVIIRFF